MLIQTSQPHAFDALLEEILGADRRGGPTPWGWHRWNDLLQCPRKYNLLYNLNQRPAQYSNALQFGGLLHECLALYYDEVRAFLFEPNTNRANGHYDAFCQEPYWQRLLAEIVTRGGAAYFELVEDVRRIMAAYVQYYPMLDDTFLRYEITGVEEYIEVPGPFDFTTRADLVYRSEAGLWIVDHKSSRTLTEDLTSSWSINGQMLGLAYGAMQHWPDEIIRGLVINIIIRTKVPQFKRVTVPLRKDLIEAWIGHITTWARQVLPVYTDLGWPPNYSACVHRYGRCAFYGSCESLVVLTESLADAEPDDDFSAVWDD